MTATRYRGPHGDPRVLGIPTDVVVGDHHSHETGVPADVHDVALALLLISSFLVLEAVAAIVAGSLALWADAGHLLVDAVALGAALWATRLAQRPATPKWTFGLRRAEIISAAFNGVTLAVTAVILTVVAIRHLWQPTHVQGGVVSAVALVGVAVNGAAAKVLARSTRRTLNVEGSLQHILTDLYAFVATFVAGLIIVLTGFERADAVASLVVVALMVRAAWTLLGASSRILLEAAPDNVDLDDVRTHLLGVKHVQAVHDLHAWTLSSQMPVLSVHVVIDDSCFLDGHAPQILDQLQHCLAGHFDVAHSTFQLEPVSHLDHETGTH